jgi:aerobic carbon-monoxide dehydrogenase small subunit
MINVALTVNGTKVEKSIEPRTSLADFLRGACNLTGTHLGCEHGVCGACTVNVDGRPIRSCITFAAQVEGCNIRTIEGFGSDTTMTVLRSEFSREHALQCGFCTAGMLITAHDIVTRLGACGEARVREELAGNLCRCTGYAGIVQAVVNAGSAHVVEGATPPILDAAAKPASLPASHDPSEKAAQIPKKAASANAAPGATRISRSFTVDANIDRVWQLFCDLPTVAACIPGAELKSYDEDSFEGQISVNLGPIRAKVEGAGHYSLDPDNKSGVLEGAGRDLLSRSRVQGRLEFRLAGQSPTSTQIETVITFTIQGVLAQLARGPVVDSLVSLILKQFAGDARAILAGDKSRQKGRRLGFLDLVRVLLSSFRKN